MPTAEMTPPTNPPLPAGEAVVRPAAELAAAPSVSKDDRAWVALDRFVRTLTDGRQVPDQYRAAMTAICEATGAQVAYLVSESTGQILDMAGDRPPAHNWCGEFCKQLAASLPEGGLWEPREQAAAVGSSHAPAAASAALLPVEAPKRAWLVIASFDQANKLRPADLRVIRVIWRLQLGHNRHALVFDNLKEALFGIVRCLSTAIDAKDTFTCGHSERVARIAVRMGEEMQLSRGEISDLYLAGLLHDVGKIGIRDNVLLKEGPLTSEEYDHIKQHSLLGDRIISNVSRLSYLRPGVRGHHERYDGKGYPDGLSGDDIPLMARILAVADSCDAMMSARRYRPALETEKLEKIMREGAGSQWDPKIIDIFFACRKDLYAVCQRGLGQSVLMAVERAAGHDSRGAAKRSSS